MMKVYSIKEINNYLKNVIENDVIFMFDIKIEAEIGQMKNHQNGHVYLVFKDEDYSLDAVIWQSRAAIAKDFEVGQKVVANGRIGIYPKNNRVQFVVNGLEKKGDGDYNKKLEELRKKLFSEGVFSAERKKELMFFPEKIGVVTSLTGSVIVDIEKTLHKRNPSCDIYLYSAYVQGEKAVKSISDGIKALDSMGLDLIIIGRGGGSKEDLIAFNDEIVVRAVADAKTPIISAVGHGTDESFTDLAADKSAVTPTQAAEFASASVEELYDKIDLKLHMVVSDINKKINEKYIEFSYLTKELHDRSPNAILMNLQKESARLINEANSIIREKYLSCINKNNEMLKQLLVLNPSNILYDCRLKFDKTSNLLETNMKQKYNEFYFKFKMVSASLEELSPSKRLNDGYAFITDKNNKRVTGVKKLKKGEKIKMYFKDGEATAVIDSIN